MNKKLTDQYKVSYEALTGVWYKAGVYKTLDEAKVKAVQFSNEYNTRIVLHKRTVIADYPSKGAKLKSIGIVLTPSGPRMVREYVKNK